MKKQILVLVIAVFTAVVFNACKSNETEKTEQAENKVEYTCPMHPEVIQNKPGDCPKCGMELVKKEASESEMPMQENSDSSMQKMN